MISRKKEVAERREATEEQRDEMENSSDAPRIINSVTQTDVALVRMSLDLDQIQGSSKTCRRRIAEYIIIPRVVNSVVIYILVRVRGIKSNKRYTVSFLVPVDVGYVHHRTLSSVRRTGK